MNGARTHVITGPPDQVGAALAVARSNGRLSYVGTPVPAPDGSVTVRAVLRDPDTSRVVHRPSWETERHTYRPDPFDQVRPYLVGGVAVLGVAATGAVVYGVVLAVLALVALIGAVLAWLTANLATIAACVVAVAALLVLLGSKCPGLHCPGCE